MNHESLIGFLELTSVIIAGGLGIAGTITETKDKKGRLTKWGIVALAGIILSNSFSFIQTYLQREKEAEEKIANAENEQIKAEEANVRYKEQIDRLTLIVNKSDSALKQQITLRDQTSNIQNQTSSVLTEVGESVDIQNRIFKQSEVLNAQQKQTADKIGRTLNPLLPFKINLSFVVKADSNSYRIAVITKLLSGKVDEVRKKIGPMNNISDLDPAEIEYMNKEGILPSPLNKKFYLLKPAYQYYSALMKMFTYPSISMSFLGNNSPVNKEIRCEVIKEYFQNENNYAKAQLIFNAESEAFYLVFQDLPIHVTSELQVGSYSIQDLEDSKFTLTITDAPGFVQQPDVVFKFPPDFSRINYIKNKGLGKNILSAYNYYTYTYKADVSFYY